MKHLLIKHFLRREYLWNNPISKNNIRKLNKYFSNIEELIYFIKENTNFEFNHNGFYINDMLIMIPYIDIRGLNKKESLDKIKEFINFQKKEMNFNLIYNIIGGENIEEIRIGANGKIIVDMKDGKFFWL